MSKKSQQQSGACDEQQFWKILKNGDSQELQKTLFTSQTDDAGEVHLKRITNAVVLANCKNPKNLTPLCFVADNGYDDLIEILVRAGAKVNEADGTKQRRTPLHAAIAGEEDVVIQKLIQCGADVGSVDAEGHTVFHLAARMSARNILQFLLETCNSMDTLQPLVEGAKIVKVNLSKILALQDNSKATALHYALGEVAGGDAAVDVASILLDEYKTRLNAGDALVKDAAQSVTSSGCTVLHLLAASGASSARIAELAKQVISFGCDVSAVDADGQSALHYAAAAPSSANAAVFAAIATLSQPQQWIAERSEEISASQDDARTPFEVAVAESNKAVVEWVVADPTRRSAFVVASRSGVLAALAAHSTDAIQSLLCPSVVSKEALDAALSQLGDDEGADEEEEEEEAGDYSGHGSTTFAGSRVQAARKAASSRRKDNDERAAIRKMKQNIVAAVEKKEEVAAQNHGPKLGLGAKLLIGVMLMSFLLPIVDYLVGSPKARR